jgi:hypothetical protein
MNRPLLPVQITLILSCFWSIATAQVKFEKGYFVDNANQRTECLIKNFDWKNNPKEFTYKIADTSDAVKMTSEIVREFGIYGSSKFIGCKVKIDRSGDDLGSLTYEKDPVWQEEQLFLRVLVEGNATLYTYVEGGMLRFFYSRQGIPVNQLVYKRYSDGERLGFNYRFRYQLAADVKCDKIAMQEIDVLGYNKRELVNYFTKYNACTGSTPAPAAAKPRRDFFNLKLTTGFNYSDLSLSLSWPNPRQYDFDNVVSARFGIESEFVLPFNKNKWAIIFEPAYQTYKSTTEVASVDYRYIEFPLGLRYYFFLNEKAAFFLNAAYVPHFSANFNSEIQRDLGDPFKITTMGSFALGGGFGFGRLSGELRYYSSREIISDYILWSSDFNRLSFVVGYKLIKTKSGRAQ